MLCFDTKEEGCCEVMNIINTHSMVIILESLRIKIPMSQRYQIPDDCEQKPGQEEGSREPKDCPRP